ncbi:MAG: hypothetical protein JSS32_06135, partial [Verrucomicrobia bacterium]|nr:hypothetical protein [Verrucomicrobiota bacterium]
NLTSTAGSGTPTSNAYGLFVDQATLANTTTAYGLYVLSPIGAGTNISGYFSTAPVFGTPLLVVSGGTGRTVLTTSGVLLGEGSNNINVTAAGTDGQVLIGSSTGDPAFATISSITGTMTFVINHNNLSIDVKAPLPLAYGGTNNTSYGATASVVYYDGTKLNAVSIGTSGQLLVSQGPGLPPVFQSAVASGTVSTIDLEGSVIDNSRPAILKVGTNFVLGATTTSAQYDIWATSVFAANPGTTYNNVYGASITPTITATGSGSVGNIYGTYINYSSTAATGSATGNAYGLFVDAISVQNTTSAYGLYVRTPTGASVSNITAVLGVLPTAQVGIGTGAPGSMLGVAGTVAIGSYAGTAAPANSLIVSGQVGIGTVSPSQTLDVAGSIRASGLTQANQLINIFQGYDQGGFGSGYVGTQKTISGNNSAYFDTATFVNSNSIAFAGAVSDGRFIYFVPNGSTTSTGQITRYDTASSFSSSNSFAVFDLTANVNSLANGFFGAVSTGRIIYFIPGTNFSGTRSGLVVRFDTALSFTAASSYSTFDMTVNVNSNSNGFFGGIYDGRYVYYAPSGNASGTQSGQITRFDPTGSFTSASSYSVFDTATVQSLSNGFQSAVFDGRYVYFVPSVNVLATRSGQVTRYDTSLTFTSASSYATFDMATVSTFAVGFEAGAFDGRFVYFAPNFNLAATSSGAIARYDTTLSFTSSASYSVFDTTVNVNSNSNGFIGAIFDNRYVYFLPNANASGTRSGQITRFDTTLAFTSASSYSIFNLTTSSNSLSNGFVGGVFDGRHIYLAPGTNVLGRSGQIARLDGYPGSQATALAANAAPNGFIMPTISYASVLYSGGATTTIAGAAPGASGTVLTSNGVGVAPSFQPAAGGASTQTINNISSSGTFSVSTSYSYYSVDSGSGAITLKFPNTTTGGQSWVIKDRTGNTALNNIIITTVSGTVTFDGETTFNLINPFGSVNIVYNSTSAAYEIY